MNNHQSNHQDESNKSNENENKNQSKSKTTSKSNLSFLLRPPVTQDEVDAAAPHIHQVINSAYDVYQAGGVEALVQYLSDERERNKQQNNSYNRNNNNRRKLKLKLKRSRKISKDVDDIDVDILDDDILDDDDDDDDDDNDDAKINGDPRTYQVMMVERAIKQNTIIQLNTGLGKTLIAILTIKHFGVAGDYKKVNAKGLAKQTWFLVPSVALAIQQSNTLRVNLPFTVAVVCHTGG